MAAHGLALGQALAERAACVDSIKWLGQHLPETVVQFLIDEIEAEETDEVAVSKSILSPQADSPDEIQIHARESSLSKGHPEAKNDDDSYHLHDKNTKKGATMLVCQIHESMHHFYIINTVASR
jgi:hypothetical protein